MAASRTQMEAFCLYDLPPSEIVRLRLLNEHRVSFREDALQQCLLGIKALLSKHLVFTTYPKVFMSYAWAPEGVECTQPHDFLKRLKDDLTVLGLSVFLDLEKMMGNMKVRMHQGLQKVISFGKAC